MNASDRFLRFAAECEAMAKITRSAENEVAWHQMAERWFRLADLVERQSKTAHSVGVLKEHRKRPHSWTH